MENFQIEFEKWLHTPRVNPRLKQQLQQATTEERADMLGYNLEFGTGGMRGIVGPGSNRMNEIVIAKATAGFGQYLQATNQEEITVVIGYDNRHFSREFALEAAKVLSALQIKAYVFETLTATPIVSYAIRALQATAGIIITASHNPSQYNGYKIYDQTGCQLLPEAIAQVIENIEAIADPFSIPQTETHIQFLDDRMQHEYIETMVQQICPKKQNYQIKVGFSSQHGTALAPVKEALNHLGCEYQVVLEQAGYDPDFSGTKSANPEDEQAFELLKKYGEKYQLDILLTTDPDADRVGIAYWNGEGYQCLNGNQVGALLTDYYLRNKPHSQDSYLVKTIVTSDLGAEIARSQGIEIIEVLTGFKYIGDVINRRGAKNFFLGYEESYGYLVAPITRDKDGIQILVALIEIANEYAQAGYTLGEKLEQIYQQYGYYLEELVTIDLPSRQGMQQMEQIYQAYKQLSWDDLDYLEDYETLVRTNYQTQQQEVIDFDASKVLKIVLTDGSWLCVRPSGTEPKLKVYVGVKEANREAATACLAALLQRVQKTNQIENGVC